LNAIAVIQEDVCLATRNSEGSYLWQQQGKYAARSNFESTEEDHQGHGDDSSFQNGTERMRRKVSVEKVRNITPTQGQPNQSTSSFMKTNDASVAGMIVVTTDSRAVV
jgi:hypothetical protein